MATAKPKVNTDRRLVMFNLQGMNQVFEEYFGVEDPPARTTFQAAKIIAGAKLEIELQAFIP